MSIFSFRLVPGEWYLLITCATKHVLFPDPSKGKSKIGATFGWTCPTCQHHDYYKSEELERYEYQLGAEVPKDDVRL